MLANEPPLREQADQIFRRELRGTIVQLSRSTRGLLPFRLVIRSAAGDTAVVLLTLVPDVELPLESGQAVQLTYLAKYDSSRGVIQRALAIYEAEGPLRIALQEQGLLSSSELPAHLSVQDTEPVVYTESGTLGPLCHTILAHRTLSVATDTEAEQHLAPSQRTEITLGGLPYLFVSIDNAVTLQGDCPDFRPDRQAWFLLSSSPR